MGDRIVVMNGGHIEQIGKPMELYADPATQFVAGFIGSPPMNLLPGRAEGKVVVLADGTRLETTVEHLGPVTVGFRPEHLLEGAAGPNVLMLPVRSVQELGGSVSYFADLAGNEIEACEARQTAVAGGQVRIAIEPGRILLFDESGARVR